MAEKIYAVTEAAAARGRLARWFYVAIAFVLLGIVLRGFWPSYFGPLLRGEAVRPWFVHLHAAVFTGWMVLLLVQATLAATGRVGMHRRLGRVGIVYAGAVLVLGLALSIVAPVLHVRAGEWSLDRAAGFLLLPLVDMVLFAGFFAAAIVFRTQPEIHKRLILAATLSLAFAAVARMQFTVQELFYLVWLSPLFAAMGFDILVRRRVHPVHFISAAILSFAFVRLFFLEWEPWLKIGRALLEPFI